jgi:hypothetical protein
MSRKFTREERTAGYLAYTTIGLVTGTTAALAQNSLYTGGWPLPLFAGALGAVSFFAVDCLTKATPTSPIFQEQDDPEHPRLQNLRNPGDTPDHPQNPDDQSGMGAAARNPDHVTVVKKPEQEEAAPTSTTLKPLRTKMKARHLPTTTNSRQGPHPASHPAEIPNPTDNHMQR